LFNFNRKFDNLINIRGANVKPRGITLVELVVVVTIILILAGISVPVYVGYKEKARNERVFAEIRAISLEAFKVFQLNGVGPATLDEVGYGNYLDPWGNPYQYYNIVTATGKGFMRKDKFLVPINTDFDLYSMGKDGKSVPPLTSPVSKDDFIRANDGEYIGPALLY
jgi:general secretion pathway protein G